MVGGSPVKHDESERIVVDALLDIPAVFKSDDVRLAVRVYTDLPVSQEGPSDIRVSLLFSASLDKLFN